MSRIISFCVMACVLFLVPGSWAAGSNDPLDSLKRAAYRLPDTSKVYAFSDLCYEYRFINGDSALKYGNMALVLAKKLGDGKGRAQALNDLGIIYADRTDYETALQHYHLALEIRQQLDDTIGIGALHNKIGIIHQKKGAYAQAIDHQLQALRIFEQLGIQPYVATCQNNIAILHFNLGNFERSLEMHREALETRRGLGHAPSVAASLTNIGNVFLESGDTAQAAASYEEAAAIYEGIDDPEGESTNLHNWASCFIASNPQKALDKLNRALSIRTALADEKMLASTHASIGNSLLNLGQYQAALPHFRTALKQAERAGVLAEQLNTLEQLALLHRLLGNADSTYLYYSRQMAMKDSVFNAGLRADFAELQTKYETERKEASIALLSEQNKVIDLKVKQQRTQLFLVISALLILLVISVLFYFRITARKKAELAEATIREREAGLKAVIEATEAERSRIARDLHDGVGQQLSGLKMGWQKLLYELKLADDVQKNRAEKLTDVLDQACAEVRDISHRMMPKSLERYGLVPALEDMLEKSLKPAGIQYSLENFVPDGTRFSADIELTLFRVVQELVNNILRHAGATEVSVQLIKNGKQLIAIVEDNGKGLNTSERTDGIGLQNIQHRLRTIGGSVHFESQNGTCATVRISLANE
jgi:signal transduction histidine kinase